MIGLALSGGGSSAMAFHLGCLRALHEIQLLSRVGVLSTISGGSVRSFLLAVNPHTVVISSFGAKQPEKMEQDLEEFAHGVLDNSLTGFKVKIMTTNDRSDNETQDRMSGKSMMLETRAKLAPVVWERVSSGT